MRAVAVIILTVSMLAASPAAAQGRGLGVGAEGTVGSGVITGGGGPTVVYDLETIFIEGGLAFVAGDGEDAVTLGASCYYKLATTEASDFSLGGGAALLFVDPDTRFGDANLGVAIAHRRQDPRLPGRQRRVPGWTRVEHPHRRRQ